MRRFLTLLAAAFLALAIPAAARADDTTAPVITYSVPAPNSVPSGPFTVSAKITDESKFYPQVFFRRGPGPYEKALDMKKAKSGAKDTYEATIPYKTDYIEFYIEAYDDFGNGPARAGDPDSPLKVTLGTPPPPPVASATTSTTSTTTTTSSTTTTTGATASTTPAKTSAPSTSMKTNGPAGSSSNASGGRTWTWIVGGVGLGLLAGGLIAGLAVKTEDDAFKTEIAGSPNGSGQTQVTDPSGLAAQHDANASLGTKATILTITGAVLLAGGIVLFFVEPGIGGGSNKGMASEDLKPAPAQAIKAPESTLSSLSFGAAPVQNGGAVAVAGHF